MRRAHKSLQMARSTPSKRSYLSLRNLAGGVRMMRDARNFYNSRTRTQTQNLQRQSAGVPYGGGGQRRVTQRKRTYSKKPNRGFVKKVLQILNPPISYMYESSFQWFLSVNKKYYCDLGAVATNAVRPFMSENHVYTMLVGALATVSQTYSATAEYWILNALRVHEITNVSNSPVYIKVHTLTCKQGLTTNNILQLMDTFIANNTNAMYPDEATSGRELMVITSGTDYSQYQTDQVMTDVTNSHPLKGLMSRDFNHQISKEYLLEPQGILKYNLRMNKKPYLFSHAWEQLNGGGSFATNLIGQTKYCFIEVVGQTARGSVSAVSSAVTSNHVLSLPGSITVITKDYFKTVSRSAPTPKFSVGARVDHPALASFGLVMGEENNAPVNAAG